MHVYDDAIGSNQGSALVVDLFRDKSASVSANQMPIHHESLLWLCDFRSPPALRFIPPSVRLSIRFATVILWHPATKALSTRHLAGQRY
jgi:hypothetical protein